MIVFENDGEIDLRLVTTFGVRDKVGENPIGYFGTGLKYAIAVCLREGVKIVIWKGTRKFSFHLRQQKLRSTTADWVVMSEMGDERAGEVPQEHVLAFTSKLGRNWEFWQAFRELACNALDEVNGSYTRVAGDLRESLFEGPSGMYPGIQKGRTVVAIEGPLADEAYDQRSTILLDTTPIYTLPKVCEIHQGDGKWIYYRGIRVYKPTKPSLYNYNILAPQDLTEDRTLKNTWMADYAIARAIAACEDSDIVSKVLTAPRDKREHALDMNWSGMEPSQTFLTKTREYTSSFTPVNRSAVGLFTRHVHTQKHIPEDDPTPEQGATIQRLEDFWSQVIPIHNYPIKLTSGMGPEVIARAYQGGIYISSRAISGNIHVLAIAVLEAFLNLHYDVDASNDQKKAYSFMLELYTGLAERFGGQPLDPQRTSETESAVEEEAEDEIPF